MKKNILLIAVALCLISCGKNADLKPESTISDHVAPLRFKKADFGKKWPFSIDEIEIYCTGYKEVYFRADGKTYPLNGTAKSASRKNDAISDEEEIWLDNPEIPGTKIPYPSVFFEKGLALCKY